MAVYANSEQLTKSLKSLFDRIKEQGPLATKSVSASRLVIRLRCHNPSAQVIINGRQNPVRIVYGNFAIHPDIDVELSADALHRILLAELPLRKAISSGQMKVHGPLFKTFALEDIFHRGQEIYPQLVRDSSK
jgi:hypothetical protein